MKKKLAALLASGMILFSGISFAADLTDEGYVEAEGFGEAGQPDGPGRRSAVMDAYRYLAEQVDDLHISSSTTVRQSRTVNDEINSNIESIIHGAKVISVSKEKDGSFRALVRLSAYGSPESLVAAVLPKNKETVDFPKPKYTNTESSASSGVRYTGVIIDCRGLGLETAVSPAIMTSGGEKIYDYANLDYQNVLDHGMVAYSHKMDSGVERAGIQPLVVKAVSVHASCDPVISQEDADKILVSNQAGGFLKQCSVVFVR
ncbi:MAG: LPP20 family lipoprotein [Schwartzia sp.]|nr:LPP20 family lipoprotein [Schwartzia sp. (in: firmicutes)]